MNFNPSRRSFLKTSSELSIAALAMHPSYTFAQADKPAIIDCHLHCFAGKGDSRYPYAAQGPYQPELAATPEQLIKCMDGAGVSHAIVVHPEPYQDDNRYLEHCLSIGNGRLKGVALVFSDRPGSLEQLPELVKRMDIVAVRVHA